MMRQIENFGSGRVKPATWKPFTADHRSICGHWSATGHLHERIDQRHILPDAVDAVLTFADLFVSLGDGKLKLACSRKAIKRACHTRTCDRVRRQVRKLVVIVSEQGAVVTAWLEQARSLHPVVDEDRYEMVIH
ncbi:hypothetical protein [Emcibacter sp. SYSU 3D8]|uniref:hypothetical protein n=1 Tax=Emcibacter sp. SYSU 3D8 TaxID=3133969 RepID=UPI0031FEE2CB